MATKPLRILLVEDSPDDAALVLRELKRGGFAMESQRVDTEPDFLAAIEGQFWDMILSDFSMPHYNGLQAFDMLIKTGLDIPFIFVSGRIGEDRAADAMLRGAKDYVLKDNLKRLVPAVERELKHAEERRKRQVTADALRESDEKLRANERLLRTVFDTLPMYLVVKDAETRYLKVNRAWCERYGLTPEQVIGKKSLEIPGRPEEDKRDTLDQDRQTLASDSKTLVFEGWDTTASGEIRHFRSIRAPLRDESGKVTGLVGASVDLTELKRAEEALQQNNLELESANEELQALQSSLEAEVAERTLAEQRFRQLVELAPNAMVTVNAEGRIVLVNAQVLAWFGYGRDELIGQPVEMLIPERYRAGHPALVSGFFRAPAPRTIGTVRDLYGLRKDGSEFPVDISLSPIETADGLQVIASVMDLTAIKRAEAELRASQRLLQTVFDTLPVTLAVKDAESRYRMVNRAWCEQYGVAPEQVVGLHTLDIPYRPEQEKLASLEQDRKALAENGGPVVSERWDTISSGQMRFCHGIKAVIRDEQGRATGLVATTVDVTEQKRAEEKLRASERLLSTVFDTIPHMLVVKDTEGRMLMVNKAWSDARGIAAEAAVNRRTLDLPDIPEEEKRGFIEEDRQVVAGDSTHAVGERIFTIKGGAKRAVNSIKAPLRDESGKIIGLVGVFVDVTAEREAQRNADLARARLVDAIESLPAGFFLYDAEERLVLWNSRVRDLFPRLFANLRPGMLFEEMLRILADSVAAAEGRPEDWVHERLAQFRAPESFELHLTDGRWVQVLDRRTLDGGTVCLRFDVTETKHQEELLRQSQKLEAIGSLAGGISHDFNNLLTVISSHAEFIVEADGGPGQIREDAQMILDASARAAALTRQLLAFSRKQVLQMRILDINATVGNLEKMLQRLIGEDIELHTSLAPTTRKIRADPTQIEQIILNLAVNSRDAMPKGGKLLIETANKALDASYAATHADLKPGDYVMLAVTDTGEGMSMETQARIFEPFFTTKALGKGTGMGLATVYGIVKQMNGSISVYSELGKGTTFKIYFPITIGDLTTAIAAESPSQRQREKETVLLVEDEDMVRKSAARILEGEGYTVLQASDAEEALKIVGSHGAGIDLLLSDVVMPGLSGRELWDRIRETRPIPVLFMSGYTDDAIVRHGILEGGVPFINKPFTKLSLLNKVREVLDNPIPNGITAR